MSKILSYVNNPCKGESVLRKVKLNLNEIIEQISALRGIEVNMKVNKGRKKFLKYTGVVENTYPSVFTVKVDEPKHVGKLSYSYSDVLCGDVSLRPSSSVLREK